MDAEVTKAKVRLGARFATSTVGSVPIHKDFGDWDVVRSSQSSGTDSHTPTQLLGFGSALLDNVDPNPENFVGAGIIQTKALQVGCLLRLEPNAQAQVRAAEGGPPPRLACLLCVGASRTPVSSSLLL